jgi:acyl-coenzyme A thioesterase PaaI-like protein
MANSSNPHFDKTVRSSFAAQRFMATIGARLERLVAGEIEIRVPFELIARSRVVRAGRTITVCQAEASMLRAETETAVATMFATIMTIRDRPDVLGLERVDR